MYKRQILDRGDSFIADYCVVKGRVQTIAGKESAAGLVDHGRVKSFPADRSHGQHAAIVKSEDSVETRAHNVIRYQRIYGHALNKSTA